MLKKNIGKIQSIFDEFKGKFNEVYEKGMEQRRNNFDELLNELKQYANNLFEEDINGVKIGLTEKIMSEGQLEYKTRLDDKIQTGVK